MAYCPNCGSKLVDGDVFCGNCGKRIEAAAAPCEPVFSQAPTEESESPTKETKPKSGITRCPACGEIVDKNAVICPSCGFGIRDVADGSIALLSQKLDLIESKRPQKRKKDENDTISATDERKISLIRSWPIPTNKDDLIEFAAMASGNCVAPPNDHMYRTAEDALADAWRSKFDQAYAKAEHLFGNSEDFVLLVKLKTDIQRRAFISRLRSWGPLIALVLFSVAFLGFSCIMSAYSGE
jgi:uncharacterized Zn finger protein (UPF0148 family)